MAYDERGPRGREGSPGIGVATARLTANGELVLQLTTGEEINAGRVRGLDGAKGIDGRNGVDGRNGIDGSPGARGADGLSIKGDTGEPGVPGKHGLSILSGATKPGKRKGRVGEFWIDWTAWRIYGPKTADGWPDGVRLLGPQGPEGPQGPKGDKPKHEWQGTKLRFEKPDGNWGVAVDLRGPDGLPGRSGGGGGGGSGGITDAPIDGTSYVRRDGAWAASSGGGDVSDLTDTTNLLKSAAEIRAMFSAVGDLGYNSTTGEFSFSETYANASEILAALLTVDGDGSGSDADLLDGQHASAFALAGHTHDDINNGTAFADGDATPDVSSGLVFKTANTSPTTITNFDGVSDGKRFELHFDDANTTVAHNANIKIAGSTSFVALQYDMLICRKIDGVWRCR